MIQHPLGCHKLSGRTYFTLYAPYARSLRLLLFDNCSDTVPFKTLPMRAMQGGYWEYTDIGDFDGLYYAFQMNDDSQFIADPYARSLATFNDHHQEAKAYIHKSNFDWQGDTFQKVSDPRDLVIYEAHVKDMTAHSSSNVSHPGTYMALIEKIPYLKSLGINALELLPVQLFANYEPPYATGSDHSRNTWNPYAYNHWGYMTSYFFAPAGIYSTQGTREAGTWCDPKGQEIEEFKALVKALHQAGISVILDVVYNHISQYNLNPLRILAEDHYIDPYANTSGCGNDIKSHSSVARKLITDSIRYWTKEFHVDGFRFDLAGLLDDKTLIAIRQAAMSVNPNVILLGEPWGKRYFPQRMSDLQYAVWNDVYRNGVKGENPHDRKGYIFAEWDHSLYKNNFTKLLTGTLKTDGGLVNNSRFSVNYIASHDGYTLGDFIRMALEKKTTHIELSQEEVKIHKLAAFVLTMSQGVMMMHAGQEYARSKVIVKQDDVVDDMKGRWDHDSYNKDNETNYINYEQIETNTELKEFYRKLIAIRKMFPELRSADRKKIRAIFGEGSDFALGYLSHSSKRTCAVLINSSPDKEASFDLVKGDWDVIVTPIDISENGIEKHQGGRVAISAQGFILLVKR
ncbi:MAG: alpha-amylase family glycosyl hydrolase [Candidatus Neomarinimicrobiota bacterium]